MGEFVIAGGDAAPVLESTEGALDDIPGPISDGVEGMFAFASRVVGDDRLTAAPPQQGAQRITIIGGIGQTALRGHIGHQFGPDRGVPAMARADDQPPRAAVLIDRGMDFSRAPAPRPSDRLLLRPPFPPAADRCALTGVASSSSATGGPPASDSRANTPSQTPLRAQRTNRLYNVLDGP